MSKFGTAKPPAGTMTSWRQVGDAPEAAHAGPEFIVVVTPVGKGKGGRLSTWSVPALLMSMICSAPQQPSPEGAGTHGPSEVLVVEVVDVVVVLVVLQGVPAGWTLQVTVFVSLS